MTEIHVIGSSSSANGYILVSKRQALFVELGCKVIEYYDALRMDERIIIYGALVSHLHSDHYKQSNVKELARRGVFCYVGEKVYDEVIKTGVLNGIRPLPARQKTFVGGFTIQSFEVAHNVPNYGFLIETPSGERIVFVTDAIECKYRFKDIDCIMVECNHDDETLLENLEEDEVSQSHPENHLGLSDCINFCDANLNVHLKQIILIHLSHANINENYALSEVRGAIGGIPVAVAHPDDRFVIENDIF